VCTLVAVRLPYPIVCVLLGLVLGWIPGMLHGPIPEKWSYYYYGQTPIDGIAIVRGYYVARLSVGLLVGITAWPQQWWLRGPLCGALLMLPLGMVALANPLCGAECMFWNTLSAGLVGLVVGGLAFLLTGKSRL